MTYKKEKWWAFTTAPLLIIINEHERSRIKDEEDGDLNFRIGDSPEGDKQYFSTHIYGWQFINLMYLVDVDYNVCLASIHDSAALDFFPFLFLNLLKIKKYDKSFEKIVV